MSFTCFELDGSSSGKRLCIQVWFYSISSIVATTVCLILRSYQYQYRTQYSSYKSAYSVASKIHSTIHA